MHIFIIQGPNLNLLGEREKNVYGTKTQKDLWHFVKATAKNLHVTVSMKQTNSESRIVTWIQKTRHKKNTVVLLNAGAYTHYSYAIHDAISSVTTPVIEVHLSNILMREDFRKNDCLVDVCKKRFMGDGFESYSAAMNYAVTLEGEKNGNKSN